MDWSKIKKVVGYVICSTPYVYKDKTESGIYLDITYHKDNKRQRWGVVLAVPDKLPDEVHDREYLGNPVPKHYYRKQEYDIDRGKEVVVNRGKPEIGRPYLFSEQEHVIEKGDKLFFSHLTLAEEQLGATQAEHYEDTIRRNQLDLLEDGTHIFYVPWRDIICVEKPDGRIIPFNGKVLCEPVYGKIESKTVIASTEEKPLPNRAKIAYIGDATLPVGLKRECRPGTEVLTTSYNFFKKRLLIGDKEYGVMNHEDIIAEVKGKKIIPVADYIMYSPMVKENTIDSIKGGTSEVNPDLKVRYSKVIVLEKIERKFSAYEKGKVMGTGKTVTDVDKGDMICANTKNPYYLYLKEKNLAFAREEDVYYKGKI
ncbi:MAG: hypothetical protein F6K19_01645 [Cyanothece sp. SIO1E1]|nr:hypothetical protein [Cyanothece sp. SIO1E1]